MKRLALLALFSLALALPLVAQPQLGIQSWTCRNMTFEQVVEFAKTHGIKNLQMISKHVDPNAPAAENLKKKAVLEAAGLRCYTFGVSGTSITTMLPLVAK